MSRFYICEVNDVQFLTKLSFYRKSPPEIYDRLSKDSIPQVDAEIHILKTLKKEIIDKGISPCILEIIYDKICEGMVIPNEKTCRKLGENYEDTPQWDVNQLLCVYADLVSEGLALDKCAFIVMERCDMSLDEYLRKTIQTPVEIAVFKSILFQIIYTIYAIGIIYPSFRHYDLHTENIMLKFDTDFVYRADKPVFLQFKIKGKIFTVPYFGIISKIIDFGFSVIPEEGIISNAVDDRVSMYHRTDNDLLFLFHWINYTVYNAGTDKTGSVDDILSALEPNQTYIQYRTEKIRHISDKIPTYDDMVNNSVFDEYVMSTDDHKQFYGKYTTLI
jgi:serine/threonine protein kinase